ncbi:uncharacterized protein LOC142324032 [Lycorma delicatula]|uniref:uncharacterized protein LOC142324032 n=1 Tax=Lycorma delicatula TaxID=130591 RepID=UPI003F517C6A
MMVANTEKKSPVKMAGYLEKRGKMRMVCRWKRLWFVLKGRLLHYYKSQMEYVNLSPCRGSLNMGIAASVRPGKGLELQVLTRSQSIILRAANRLEQEQWLQALLDAMAIQDCHAAPSVKPVQHFRYPSNTPPLEEDCKKLRGSKSYDHLPKTNQNNCDYLHHDHDHENDNGDNDSNDSDDDNNDCITDNGSNDITSEITVSLLPSKSSTTVNHQSNYNRKLSTDQCNCNKNRQSISMSSVNRSNTLSPKSLRLNRNQNLINKKIERFSLKNSSSSSKLASSDTAILKSLQNQTSEDFNDNNNNNNSNSEKNNDNDSENKCQSLKELHSNVLMDINTDHDLKINETIHKSEENLVTKCNSTNNTKKDNIIFVVNRSESLNSLKIKSTFDKKYLREMKLLIEGRTVYGSNDSVFTKANMHLKHNAHSCSSTNSNNNNKHMLKELQRKYQEEEKLEENINKEKENFLPDDETKKCRNSIKSRGGSLYENKEIKSDTDLSLKKQSIIISGSCGELSTNCEHNCSSLGNNCTDAIQFALNKELLCKSDAPKRLLNLNDQFNESHSSNEEISNFNNVTTNSNHCNKIKSNSILRRLIIKDKDNSCDTNSSCNKDEFSQHTLERKGTLKKHSLSFLRRMWKWKENKNDNQNQEVVCKKLTSTAMNTVVPVEITTLDKPSSSSFKDIPKCDSAKSLVDDNVPCPEEPLPDYDGSVTEDHETVPPELPPRLNKGKEERPDSPWHDTPTNNKPIEECTSIDGEDKPPPLPKKTRKSTKSSGSELSMNASHNYVNYDISDNSIITTTNNNCDLANIEHDLVDPYNNFRPFPQPELVDDDMSNKSLQEPLYDIPRPHATLRASLRKVSQTDKLIPTRFFNSSSSNVSSHKPSIGSIEFDSLDANPALWRSSTPYDSVMTPDSLECESPWSLNSTADEGCSLTITSWHHQCNMRRPSITSETLPKHFITIEEKIYEDSLND